MAAQAVTLHLPHQVYDRLRRRAERKRQSVEAELMEMVTSSIPDEEELPPDLARMVEDLAELDDQALWRAARDCLPGDAVAQLEALNLKQQREGLTASETTTRDRLLLGYERLILMRAEASGLLEERGLRPEESRSASNLEEPRPKAAAALLELAGIGDSGLGDLGRRHDDYLAEDFDR